eukprot:TRINITY_DN8694_c0_g1_i1.p1 TRINITY_DN8694_c0_g1~~TRINITY_DN8694_c0_g1_i1.p1  ORF type:complete len:377 (-),score=118.16 TRINITY_DN8694_c0_g1_i1:14-1144(-)
MSEEELLRSIFPEADEGTITRALTKSKNDVEGAADLILNGGLNEKSPEISTEKDEIMARKLEEEMKKEDQFMERQDEELARLLQSSLVPRPQKVGKAEEKVEKSKGKEKSFDNSEENSEEQISLNLNSDDDDNVDSKDEDADLSEFNLSSESQPDNSFGNIIFSQDEPLSMSQEKANEILTYVKNQLIPTLVNSLNEFEIPSVQHPIDSPIGIIELDVTSIFIKQILVPLDQVDIKILPLGLIQLIIPNVEAETKEFDWKYKKEAAFLPKVTDDGKAKAGFKNGKLEAVISSTGGSDTIQVDSCNFTIENLDVDISGTRASFLYSLLISAFSKTLQNALETEIKLMVHAALAQESFSTSTKSDFSITDNLESAEPI